VTLLLNLELVSKARFCLVTGLPHIVKDYPKMRNLPKIFLRSFENVSPDVCAVMIWSRVWVVCFSDFWVSGILLSMVVCGSYSFPMGNRPLWILWSRDVNDVVCHNARIFETDR